ncbi:MAG TPA: protein disulfide isomerase family protein [Candidatus Ozemobacteraceae bacterium]|nr:protein disulfide isomerase family protein [Candidatus Ozemobacteraceae bacterium]
MKLRSLFVLVLCFLLTASLALVASDDWLKNIDDGLKQAKAENKIVMVDFTATWCGWCKKLQTDVFDREEFQKFAAEHLVLVSIDADANRDLVTKYGVEGFPTIVFLNANGDKIHTISGYLPLEGFLSELQEAQKKSNGGK